EGSVDETEGATGTATETLHSTATETGNRITGSFSSSTSATDTSITREAGTDARGTFTSSVAATATLNSNDAGNVITGSHPPSSTDVAVTTGSKSGGDTNTYAQDFTDAVTTVVQDTSANEVTGAFTRTATISGTSDLTEVGAAETNYTLTENDTSDATVTSSG